MMLTKYYSKIYMEGINWDGVFVQLNSNLISLIRKGLFEDVYWTALRDYSITFSEDQDDHRKLLLNIMSGFFRKGFAASCCIHDGFEYPLMEERFAFSILPIIKQKSEEYLLDFHSTIHAEMIYRIIEASITYCGPYKSDLLGRFGSIAVEEGISRLVYDCAMICIAAFFILPTLSEYLNRRSRLRIIH